MRVFRLITKIYKSNYFIAIELFLAFTFLELGSILLGFDTVFAIAWGIEMFLIKISFVLGGLFIFYKVTKRLRKTDISFKDWLLFKR
jgi:hypothetical protein